MLELAVGFKGVIELLVDAVVPVVSRLAVVTPLEPIPLVVPIGSLASPLPYGPYVGAGVKTWPPPNELENPPVPAKLITIELIPASVPNSIVMVPKFVAESPSTTGGE